jgi:hypothetical protein
VKDALESHHRAEAQRAAAQRRELLARRSAHTRVFADPVLAALCQRAARPSDPRVRR